MSDQHNKEIDQITGVETTGHEWDGLKELNNPAPRWWVWVWVATFVLSVGYWVVYPAWPTAWPFFGSGSMEQTGSVTRTTTGATEGIFGWTQYEELAASQAEITARQAQYLDKFQATTSYDQISQDPELYAFAQAGGKALFKNNCAVCHGSGAEGGVGFPNLNDDDWLWGGTLADIEQTLRYGVRSEHDETRQSLMPSFGKDELLEKEEIEQVVDYVLTLSSDTGADTNLPGAEIFANNCASCHGEKGTGGRDFGAPNLTDSIWLYGGERADVSNTVYFAHAGVMPFWEGKLDEDSIRQLTLYVHSLGGGEGEGAAVPEKVSMEAPAEVPAQTEEEPVVTQEEPVAEEPTSEAAPEAATELNVDAPAEPSVKEGATPEAVSDESADR
ncbi:MAG: cytochrome-c oxidase, cbb3-type subunit III [Alphaproteobacteria bacterium CG1_02_46_17]|nr:MAG: cytochrome-c oxidase, cbb3-type subunit III [Alphaproteobacteria bacterium CG1_02_46_17]